MQKISIFIYITIFTLSPCYAKEADNYTLRGEEKLDDSSDIFNQFVNNYIQKSLNELESNQKTWAPIKKIFSFSDTSLETISKAGTTPNIKCTDSPNLTSTKTSEPSSQEAGTHQFGDKYKLPTLPKKLTTFNAPLCDRELLFEYFQSNLDQNWPEARDDMLVANEVQRGRINNRNGSIYKNTAQGILQSLGGCCDPLVNINKHYVGIDKLDHFLGHGAEYFKEYQKKFNIEDTLKMGVTRENGGWGLSGTGVKSYGDMAANYAGLYFWANLLDGDSPYIKCEEGQFKFVKKFNVKNFITPAMDEAINCSGFNTAEVGNAIDKYAKENGFKKICPVVTKDCKKLKKYYTKLEAKYILHPRCRKPSQSEMIPLHENSEVDTLDTIKDFINGI